MSNKRNDKESMICLTLKPSQSFFVYHIQSKEKLFTEKEFFKEKGEGGGLNKKQKQGFLTALTAMIKKDPIKSIRKSANELKVHKKTVRTPIKQDLSPDHNLLDYTVWGILENETNVTSHPNIGSLKTATEEEWNKMSEEFILKACWYNNWKKNSGHIE